MLTDEERDEVLRLIATYGYIGRRELARLRAAGVQPDLDLLARAVLEDPNPRVRWLAIDVLDHWTDHRYDEVVATALRTDPVPRVRRHAAHALACDACSLQPSPVDPIAPLLEAAMSDENPKVRQHALWGLRSRLEGASA
jgi:HEAT repeat protein